MNYREMLRSEFSKRLFENRRYSLGAFARDLGISGSRLSQVLNHKKGLSLNAAKEIVLKLGWETTRANLFCDQVESEHARSAFARRLAQSRLGTLANEIELGTVSISLNHENIILLKSKIEVFFRDISSQEAFQGADISYRICLKKQ